MGLLWNVCAAVAGIGMGVTAALVLFLALSYLAQLSIELVVLITAAGAVFLVRDWMKG